MDERVSREDLAALERRLAALEREVRAASPPARVVRCPSCAQMVMDSNFCSVCGHRLVAAAPARPAPAAAAPPPPAPAVAAVAPPPLATRPAAPPPRPAAQPLTLDRALGQRWAPRLGATLVFLGIVFFLGVAVQRGWIGPIAQLGIAVLGGAALVTAGAILTARRGYGTYPQVLEATGACVLYLTAFVAHALPYYQRETGLTEIGSAILMALVALGTVALALARNARIIAGLGYGLAFLTALLGTGVLPGLTLAYVALLGTSLAMLVAPKGWLAEGVLGSLATGGLLLALAYDAGATADPDPALVAAVSLLPAAAFLWLAARRAENGRDEGALAGILTLATFAWASTVSLGFTSSVSGRGFLLLVWALVAAAHLALSARLGGHAASRAAGAAAGVILWLVGAPLAWEGWAESALLTSATYALAAVGLATAGRLARGRGAWIGALVLAGAAALHAIFVQALLMPPWELGPAFGSWQAWVTFALVFLPLALVGAARAAGAEVRTAAFWVAAAFGTLWTFALFGTPFLATLWLLIVAGALVGLGLAARERDATVATSAVAAAFAVLALAALKGATFDTHAPQVRLDALPAAAQAILVAGSLLALFHLARARQLVPSAAGGVTAAALIGGSALVLVNYLIAYTEGPWPSILIGVMGVAYLVAGFLRAKELSYRYTGFGVLGFVLLRVFTVDMQNADLAIRALVFAVLGAILLGIGFAYARMGKREAPPDGP